MHKFLQTALEYHNEYDYDKELLYKLCAVIVRGGSILSIGYNKTSTNGFVEYFTDQVRGYRSYCMSTHAEHDAILKVRNKVNLSGAKIFVVRTRKNGQGTTEVPAMARCCNICENVLYRYGIRRAFYTIDEQHYGIMRIKAQGKTSDKIVRF